MSDCSNWHGETDKSHRRTGEQRERRSGDSGTWAGLKETARTNTESEIRDNRES